MTDTKRDVVVFLAHYFDAVVERRFLKLRREVSALCDVALLVEEGTEVPEALRPFAQTFDYTQVRRKARAVIGSGVVPGNCHLRAIDYYERHPSYRFYWFVEYDVVYTGDWGRFVAAFADDESDLLASHLRRIEDDPRWYWRDTVSTGTDEGPESGWILAFMAIHRISARGIEAIAARVQEGWSGHFEALVPTALTLDGLTVSDFGGSGAWTPKERTSRHYLDWGASIYLGTLRYRPAVEWRFIRNMLHHPCKTPLSTEDPPGDRRYAEKTKKKMLNMQYRMKVLRLAARSLLGNARRGC